MTCGGLDTGYGYDLEQERCPACMRVWPKGGAIACICTIPPRVAPWLRCPACGRMWRADEPTTCACESRPPAEVLHGCGKPITAPEFRAHMREMNRARVELALALGTEVTREEKAFLSNGSLLPGCMEADDAA